MDSYNALVSHENRSERDKLLTKTMLETLRQDGNVLIPVDTTARVLELLLILDQLWREQKFEYKVYFQSYVSISVIEFAQQQLEWMSESVTQIFDRTRDNPYKLP